MSSNTETIIFITDIDPVEFYGPTDEYINMVNSKFSDLKVVVRGMRIKVSGPKAQVERYAERMEMLKAYYLKYGHISGEVIDRIYDSVNVSLGGRNAGHLKHEQDESLAAMEEGVIVHGNAGNIIKARTKHQKKLMEDYASCDLLFAIGPAGSGKTYTSIALAVRALRNKEVKRIILTRPAVEAGEKLGFLPGDMKEKLDPYLQPLYDALGDMIPAKKLHQMIEEGVVQIAPLAYMRGRTLDNAFVILDEAQNTTREQLKMFLTRMGRTAKFIVTGDITQIDLPRKQDSGLESIMNKLDGVDGISIVRFDGRDILRHPLVAKIVKVLEQSKDAE